MERREVGRQLTDSTHVWSPLGGSDPAAPFRAFDLAVAVERRGRLRQPANLRGCVGGDRVNRTGRHQMKINNAAAAQINDHLNNRR